MSEAEGVLDEREIESNDHIITKIVVIKHIAAPIMHAIPTTIKRLRFQITDGRLSGTGD